MPHILTCTIRPDAMPMLKALRARHLAFIQSQFDNILAGGPSRGEDGSPETMVILLKTDERSIAEAFIANEPYSASGAIFSSVSVRTWSQVVPEVKVGALDAAIAEEARQQRAEDPA